MNCSFKFSLIIDSKKSLSDPISQSRALLSNFISVVGFQIGWVLNSITFGFSSCCYTYFSLKIIASLKARHDCSGLKFLQESLYIPCRAVARGGDFGGFSHPNIWQNSYPYLNQGGRLCPPQSYKPPKFSNLATALYKIFISYF